MGYITRYYSDDYYEEFYGEKKGNKKECKKKEEKKDIDVDIRLKQQCNTETHTVTLPTTNVNANATLILFEDFTKNHNKTLITLTVGGQPLEVSIKTRSKKDKDCDRPITAIIAANTTRAFQVEDFKSLVVSNPTGQSTSVTGSIVKTFCICCNADQDKEHHKHRDCDCD